MILSPEWFFGYDVVLEVLFAVVTLAVAMLGFRIYKVTSQRQSLYLALGFLLISISYILQSILNFLIITEMNESVCSAINMRSIALFNVIGLYVHFFFMLLGLCIIAYMTFRSDEIRSMVLISLLSIMAVFFSRDPIYMFYSVSSLLLVIISWFFIRNYLKKRKTNTLLIAIAFIFLLFGSIHFLFAVNHQLFYVIGHILGLVAYSLVLSNFFVVRRR